MAQSTKIRGKTQIRDNSIDLPKLEQNFLNGGDWNITNGLQNGTITGLRTPTNPYDAVTKEYADAIAQGLDAKDPARFATTQDTNADNFAANVLSGPSNTQLIIDGRYLYPGDRVLIKDQSDAIQNGVYDVVNPGGINNLPEITEIMCPPATAIAPGSYLFFHEKTGASTLTEHVVWFQVGGAGSAPSFANEYGAGNKNAVQVTLTGTENPTQVATALAAILNGLTNVSASASEAIVTTTQSINGYCPDTTSETSGTMVTVTQNGQVQEAWSLSRSDDFDGVPSGEVKGGSYVFIDAGTTNAKTGWVVQGTGIIDVNSNDITFGKFSSAVEYIGGMGINIIGQTINIDPNPFQGPGITVSPSGKMAADAGENIMSGRHEKSGIDLNLNDDNDFLKVNVDDTTIEITALPGNIVQVKDGGIGSAKIATNAVNTTHIDFGTSGNQVRASHLPIVDTDNYYTATHVEGAFKEIYEKVNAIDDSVTLNDAYTNGSTVSVDADNVEWNLANNKTFEISDASGNHDILKASALSAGHRLDINTPGGTTIVTGSTTGTRLNVTGRLGVTGQTDLNGVFTQTGGKFELNGNAESKIETTGGTDNHLRINSSGNLTLKDQHLSAAVALAETGVTEINTGIGANSIVGAINALYTGVGTTVETSQEQWVGAGGVSAGAIALTMTYTAKVNTQVMVFLNGIKMRPGASKDFQFTGTGNREIRFNDALYQNDVVEVVYKYDDV